MLGIDLNWYDDVASETWNYYSVHGNWNYDEKIGFVAENLVRVNCGLEPYYSDKPDDGFDLIVDDLKIDIKNTVDNYDYFNKGNSVWKINTNHKLIADRYWFTKLDPIKRRISIMGWLPLDTVIKYREYPAGSTVAYNNASITLNYKGVVIPQMGLNRIHTDMELMGCLKSVLD